ncbi:MAG: hypothetical protein ACI4EJ_05540 [Bacteroides sp.]
MVEKIACFLTCGYTEAGVMQSFLRKINGNYEYKQYLPNKTIKKKGDPKIINPQISGLTGQALLEKIYSILEKHRNEINQCKAILIEDDLDGKFHEYSDDEVIGYKKQITDRVHEKLGSELPVVIMYASPEIESWFVADWKNGFEFLYTGSGVIKDVSSNARQLFAYHLRQYIRKEILKEYADDIENYGWFDGEYIKLSDELIDAVQTKVKEYMSGLQTLNSIQLKEIVESRDLYYSKNLHGSTMLRQIQPTIVLEKCPKYFGDAYNRLVRM